MELKRFYQSPDSQHPKQDRGVVRRIKQAGSDFLAAETVIVSFTAFAIAATPFGLSDIVREATGAARNAVANYRDREAIKESEKAHPKQTAFKTERHPTRGGGGMSGRGAARHAANAHKREEEKKALLKSAGLESPRMKADREKYGK